MHAEAEAALAHPAPGAAAEGGPGVKVVSTDDIIPRRDPVYFRTERQEDAGEASKERDREWDDAWGPFSLSSRSDQCVSSEDSVVVEGLEHLQRDSLRSGMFEAHGHATHRLGPFEGEEPRPLAGETPVQATLVAR